MKKFITSNFIFLQILALILVSCSPGEHKGVSENTPFNGIYLSAEPSFLDDLAAKYLQEYLGEMSGDSIPVLTFNQGEKKLSGRILVGAAAIEAGTITKEEVEAVGEGGYFVRYANECLSIAGLTSDGTLSGIYGFLNRWTLNFFRRK